MRKVQILLCALGAFVVVGVAYFAGTQYPKSLKDAFLPATSLERFSVYSDTKGDYLTFSEIGISFRIPTQYSNEYPVFMGTRTYVGEDGIDGVTLVEPLPYDTGYPTTISIDVLKNPNNLSLDAYAKSLYMKRGTIAPYEHGGQRGVRVAITGNTHTSDGGPDPWLDVVILPVSSGFLRLESTSMSPDEQSEAFSSLLDSLQLK